MHKPGAQRILLATQHAETTTETVPEVAQIHLAIRHGETIRGILSEDPLTHLVTPHTEVIRGAHIVAVPIPSETQLSEATTDQPCAVVQTLSAILHGVTIAGIPLVVALTRLATRLVDSQLRNNTGIY